MSYQEPTILKASLKSALSETNQQVLHHFVFGMGMKEVAEIMDFKLETINKARLELFKIFGAASFLDLCKKAIEYGYAKDLVENLQTLRKSYEIGSLNTWEVIYLHEYLKGHTEVELLRMLECHEERLIEIRESVFKKLKIENKIKFCSKQLYRAILFMK